MAYSAVERVMDSAASASYVTEQLTKRFEEVFTEIVPGTDLRDMLHENKEGQDMDVVIREKAEVFGEPRYVAKRGNSKPSLEEVVTDIPFAIHELCQTVRLGRRELRQAAKIGKDIQGRRISLAKEALHLAVRKHMMNGYPELGIPGANSDRAKMVYAQANAAISGKDDAYMEAMLVDAHSSLLKENGSDYSVTHILMGTEWSKRLGRSFGDSKNYTLKRWLAENVFNIPVENFILDTRLDGAGLGGYYANKDALLMIPSWMRICEALSPVRVAFDMYESDGDLAIDVYAQHGGVALYEKIGGLANA